jgi:hypothetical protein
MIHTRTQTHTHTHTHTNNTLYHPHLSVGSSNTSAQLHALCCQLSTRPDRYCSGSSGSGTSGRIRVSGKVCVSVSGGRVGSRTTITSTTTPTTSINTIIHNISVFNNTTTIASRFSRQHFDRPVAHTCTTIITTILIIVIIGAVGTVGGSVVAPIAIRRVYVVLALV